MRHRAHDRNALTIDDLDARPRLVMGQLGHSDARLTPNVYAWVMRRQRIDEALIWQLLRNGPTSAATRPAALPLDRG